MGTTELMFTVRGVFAGTTKGQKNIVPQTDNSVKPFVTDASCVPKVVRNSIGEDECIDLSTPGNAEKEIQALLQLTPVLHWKHP